MVVFAFISTGLLLITFATTKERVVPPVEQKLTFRHSLQVFLNPPLLIVIGIFCYGMLNFCS